MQHFFVDASQVSEETIRIEGTDVNHMKNVLRMRIGEEVTVSDGQGEEYLCQVRDLDESFRCGTSIKNLSVSGSPEAGEDGIDRAEMCGAWNLCGSPGVHEAVCDEAGCKKRGEESGALEYNCSQRSQTVRAGDRAGSDVCEDL